MNRPSGTWIAEVGVYKYILTISEDGLSSTMEQHRNEGFNAGTVSKWSRTLLDPNRLYDRENRIKNYDKIFNKLLDNPES